MGTGLGSFTQAVAGTRPAAEPGDDLIAAEAVAVHAAHPSISDDGRLVVSAGRPADGGDRSSTVWITDRAEPSAAPVELTRPLETIRVGESVHPVISGDGCVVVAVTEMAYDLFRDDDGGERWDVYRLVLPHCGGAPDEWELVSTRAVEGAETSALDDVDPAQAPAVSAVGTVVAFAHRPVFAAPDGMSAVSVVDLTVALGGDGRIGTVAGTPIAAPNTTFRYRGQMQPSLSSDGRFVAFTSDADSDAPVPEWSSGPIDGQFATGQVYVWDRAGADPLAVVRLVSGGALGAADAGAESPAISGNGQYIAFRSAATNLVDDVELPVCIENCPTQIYRFDQVDGTIVLISAQARIDGQPLVAANRGGAQPAMSDDGTQVAFITRSDNLFATRSAAGEDAADGDVVVAEVDLAVMRRVSVQPDGVTPAPALHAHPSLSASGHVIVFDTLASQALTGAGEPGRRVVALERTSLVAIPDLDVGTIVVGYAGPEWYVAVRNIGPSTFIPATVTSSNPDFAVTGGTCGLGLPVPPGQSCTVNITLTPSVAGPVTATLTVAESLLGGATATATLAGAGGEPALAPSPAGLDLPPAIVGLKSSSAAFDVGNVGFAEAVITSIELSGSHPDDFEIRSDSCLGQVLHMGSSCAVEVVFAPKHAGYRTATVLVTTAGGQYTGVLVDGTGSYRPVLSVASTTVRAGKDLGVGGSGFAPGADVTLSWSDGFGPSITVTTSSDGSFLAQFPTKRNARTGERELVAQGGDVLAKATVRVVRATGQQGPGSPTWGG